MLKSDLKTHRLRREHLIVFFLSIQIGLNAQSSLSSCYRMDFIPQIESYYNSLDSIFQTRLGDNYLSQTAEQLLLLSKHFIENRIDSISIGPTTEGDLYLFETKENGMISCGQIRGPIPDCPLKHMCRLCTYYKDWCLTENKSKMIKSEINKLAIMLNTK